MNVSCPDIIKPIFIIGMNGSGTIMLADCLNHHPQIYVYKIESRIIPYYYSQLHQVGDIEVYGTSKRLLDGFSNQYAFINTNNNQSLSIPFDFENMITKDLSQVIHLTFSYFAKRDNKSIWSDHSPKYAAFIPELVDLFPHAKIIHIIRDGRDCAQSFNRRFRQNIYRTISEWKKLVRKARRDGAAIGKDRYFEI